MPNLYKHTSVLLFDKRKMSFPIGVIWFKSWSTLESHLKNFMTLIDKEKFQIIVMEFEIAILMTNNFLTSLYFYQ